MPTASEIAARGYNRARRLKPRTLTQLTSEAESYGRLDPAALLFDHVRFSVRPRSVNLLLPTVRPEHLSAGPSTALRFSKDLAQRLGLPLQVMTTDPILIPFPWHTVALRKRFDHPGLGVFHVARGEDAPASRADVWVATTWQSALSAKTAVHLGLIGAEQVVYLIQDYEPGFTAWSTSTAAARMTYHSGFLHVVNSKPLADFLTEQEGPVVDMSYVMGPDLDYERLERTAAVRQQEPRAVFFYARDASRNMLALGLASLERAATLCTVPWHVVLAGQDGQRHQIAGVQAENLGRTTYDGYFELMARTQLAFSLMMSPHPSHPPLDWAISGGWAITNEFGRSREGLHPRILTAAPDPDLLGEAIARAVESVNIGLYQLPSDLGRRIVDVIDDVATAVQ